MARLLSLMVGITFVVVLLSAIHGVDSNCANHCRERCKQINIRQRSPRLPCYIRCRKLAATCKSCSGPRWCFKCLPGYLLTTEPRCVVNKCRINNGGCDTDATCSKSMNRFGGISFTCECNSGFNGDGTSCTDVDECETNNGGCSDNGDTNAICSNNIGSFMCSCSDGFTQKGTSCIDQNECLVNRGGCHDNGDTKAVCINNRGNFTCKCSAGFTSAGTSCNEKDKCLANNGGCGDNGDISAVCVNNRGSFTCNCTIGFTFNGTTCNSLPITLNSNISLSAGVTALTSYNDLLYVATVGMNYIVVYNALTLQYIRDISVLNSGSTRFGMAVSPNEDFLYVTDFNLHSVHQVPLSSSGVQSSWQVCDFPRGIAINRQNNLLVACQSKKIEVYTLNGGLIRSISDASELSGVRVLSNGNWAVTRLGEAYFGVAVINSNDGSVQYSFGSSSAGTGTGQFSYPIAITGNSQGYLLVADLTNNRVSVLNSTVSAARTLTLPLSPILNAPYGIWLDESRGVLFVGEGSSPFRIAVFSNVNAYNLASVFAASP